MLMKVSITHIDNEIVVLLVEYTSACCCCCCGVVFLCVGLLTIYRSIESVRTSNMDFV